MSVWEGRSVWLEGSDATRKGWVDIQQVGDDCFRLVVRKSYDGATISVEGTAEQMKTLASQMLNFTAAKSK